ncbi:aldo-keto reductase protein [Ilyonectria robusta]
MRFARYLSQSTYRHFKYYRITSMVNSLPFGGQQVPVPGFGAMGLSAAMGSDMNLEQAEPVLLKAVQLGCTFWDTAVAYKSGANEKLLGDFIKKHNVRDKLFVASKCGFDVFGPVPAVTNSAAHIKEYIEGTIDRLGFTPDLYYLHRIDPNTPLEESIGALEELRRAGKTKYIGLSECSAETLRKANSSSYAGDYAMANANIFKSPRSMPFKLSTRPSRHCTRPMALSRQLRNWVWHLWHSARWDTAGSWMTSSSSPPMTLRLMISDALGENFYKNKAIVDEIKQLATAKGCTVAQIALAWVAAQGLITIPGTTKASRLEENWASRDVVLTDEELKAMRKIVDDAKPVGERFSAVFQSMDCEEKMLYDSVRTYELPHDRNTTELAWNVATHFRVVCDHVDSYKLTQISMLSAISSPSTCRSS